MQKLAQIIKNKMKRRIMFQGLNERDLNMFRIFIAFIFIFNLSGCGYNDIQTYDEQVNASWSEVLNQYQRRTDLIPNLVASIKGYSSHEQEVLEAVTLARSQANRASSDLQKTPGDEQNYKPGNRRRRR